MGFDVERAKAESEGLEVTIAAFRKACEEAGTGVVEVTGIVASMGGICLRGDLATLASVLSRVETGTVFLEVGRCDVARMTELVEQRLEAERRLATLGVFQEEAIRAELARLDGLPTHVRAVASCDGVQFYAKEVASWRTDPSKTT